MREWNKRTNRHMLGTEKENGDETSLAWESRLADVSVRLDTSS